MNSKTIIINIVPYGQPRSRHFVRNGRSFCFDPSKDKKTWMKLQIAEQYKDKILEEPVEMEMNFYMLIPKSTSKKRKKLMIDGEIKHTKKPDIDNIMIAVLNCMTNIVYHDDRQVYKITASKQYSENPRIEVIIVE